MYELVILLVVFCVSASKALISVNLLQDQQSLWINTVHHAWDWWLGVTEGECQMGYIMCGNIIANICPVHNPTWLCLFCMIYFICATTGCCSREFILTDPQNHISKPLLEIFASTLGYRLVVATMHCSLSSPLPSPLLPYMSPHPPLLVHLEGWVVGLNRWWSIPFLSVCLSETLFPAPGIPLGTFSTKSLHPCPPPCEALHDRCFCAGSWGHW